MNLINVVNVRKQYQDYIALNDVSFSVERGSIFGLLGPNGAGKTTFIRTLTQITAPDSGYILFEGEKLSSKHIADIGYLPEERGLYKKMKVGEQALYLAQLKGLDRKTAMEELKKWFIKFEIASWWNKKIEELSKGMAQKIQFIITVIHHPKLLIFDEPFSGFDPVNVDILKKEILSLRDQGATIVFSTHNMESVEELCDSIVLINHANIVLQGKVKDIKQRFSRDMYKFDIKLFDDFDENIIGRIKMISQDCIIENNHLKGTVSMKDYFCSMNNINGDAENVSANDDLHIENFDSKKKAELTNSIIRKLMSVGNIVFFDEILPTMNDIFIKTVTEKNDK